jgi:hypothetical protein
MWRESLILDGENLLDELCSSLTAANNNVLAAKRHSEHVAGAESILPPLDRSIDQLQRSGRYGSSVPEPPCASPTRAGSIP